MNKGLLISAAAAGVLLASGTSFADGHGKHSKSDNSKSTRGTCTDDNTCHNKGACGAKKGKNTCGGHKFESTKEACSATGGKWTKKG